MKNDEKNLSTLIDYLEYYADKFGDKPFISSCALDLTLKTRSFSEVFDTVTAFSRWLLHNGHETGEKALLIFADPADSLYASLACMDAGITIIPVAPPVSGSASELQKLEAVISDSGANFILTSQSIKPMVQAFISASATAASLPVICEAERADFPSSGKMARSTDIMLLQYTSGSTGKPKGIAITMDAMVLHLSLLKDMVLANSESVFLSWLPYYHDMGMIAMMFLPVFCGCRCILIPPQLFMADPSVWLRAISAFKADITGAPNFAYDLSLKSLHSMSGEELSRLDFSSLRRLFSGAEAINLTTLVQFCDEAKKYGLNRSSLLFAYGQAEATLVVSGYHANQPISWIKLDREALKHQRVKVIEEGLFNDLTTEHLADSDVYTYMPGNGPAYGAGHELLILKPGGAESLRAYEVGEICLIGPCVAEGYYKNPAETAKHFSKTDDGRRLLRTGDLGFLNSNGELFITGRIKDIIIINGENFYPEDLEQTAYNSDERAIPLRTAAFAETLGATERPVIVQEISDDAFPHAQEIADAISRSLLNIHGIGNIKVIFTAENTLPKTDSGKIQRSKAKQLSEQGHYENVFDYAKHEEVSASVNSAAELTDVILTLTAASAGVPTDGMDADRTFLQYGISSITLVRLSEKISNALSLAVPPKTLMEHDSPRALGEYLFTVKDTAAGRTEYTRTRVISENERFEPFELSPVQQAYLDGRNPELPLGGVSCYYFMEADIPALSKERFSQALQEMMTRHDNLHAVLTPEGKLLVLREWENPLIIYPLSSPGDAEAHLQSIREEMREQVFGTGRFLFDVRLSELTAGGYRVHFGIDMMIADSYGILLLQDEMRKLYKGETLPLIKNILKPAKARPSDADEAYWSERAESFPKAPALPLDIKFFGNSSGRINRRAFSINQDTWKNCKAFLKRIGCSPSSVLFALYSEVLSAWGGDDKFAVMTTVVDRDDDAMCTVDDFTQLSLTEINMSSGSIADSAAAIQRRLLSDLTHSSVDALSFLRQLARVKGEQQRYPYVFTCALDTRKYTGELNIAYTCAQTPQVLIDCQVIEYDDVLHVSWDTVDEAFLPGIIDDMFDAMRRLVVSLADSPDFVNNVVFDLRPQSQRKTFESANDTAKELPAMLLTQNLQNIARSTPDSSAVIACDKTLTYSQLWNRAMQFAGLCIQSGAEPNDRIIIALDRTSDMIAAVAGVLLSGAVYVPVSKHQPASRIAQIRDSANAKFLITDSEPIISDITVLQANNADKINPSLISLPAVRPDALAYIIFTSGSTGIPKGVAITHESAMNTIADVSARLGIDSSDRAICVSELNFDLSVYDIFGMMNAGGCIILANEAQRIDMRCLYELCSEHGVTFWNSVPAIFDMFLEKAQNSSSKLKLRSVILSGDWIPLTIPARMKRAIPGAALTSMGGATEASIWSNYYHVSDVKPDWNSIPYGFPLSNQQFYILNALGRPCPALVPGRLHIAGKGLAQEYIGSKEQTDKAFYVHTDLGVRLYDTGDYGKYFRDGCIEFLGRKDNQVKINGFRIETGEIQSALSAIGFSESVVAVDGNRTEMKKLIAFVKTDSNSGELDEYKKKLSDYIPAYMIPDVIFGVKEFPVTANGKRDVKALMELYSKFSRPASETMPTDSDNPIIKIISEIIGTVPQSGMSFYELGMASVDLIKLGNRLELVYGTRPSISEIMSYGSVQELLDYYADISAESAASAHADLKTFSFDVEKLYQTCRMRGINLKRTDSSLKFTAPAGAMTDELKAQLKRRKAELMDYLSEIEAHPEGNGRYMPFMLTPIQQSYVTGRSNDFELGGFGTHYFIEISCAELDVKKFEEALNYTIQCHDVLRTVVFDDGTQMVLTDVPRYSVAVKDISIEEAAELKEQWKYRKYNLNTYPMFDAEVINTPDGKTRIFFSFDCLILDGASSHQMLEELFAAYSGRSKAAPNYSFCQYIADSSKTERKQYSKDKAFWEERAAHLPPTPAFRYKQPLSEIKEPHFKRMAHSFDEAQSDAFSKAVAKTGCTASAFAAAAYMKVLSEWSGSSDITVNMTMFNRMPVHDSVMDILGDFTGTTFISYSSASENLEYAVSDVQSQIWNAIDHRSFSGVEILKLLTNESRRWSAIMPVVFTSMFYDSGANLFMLPPGFEISDALSATPQVVLDHQIYNRGGNLTIVWDFVQEAFDENEVRTHFDKYLGILQNIINTN